MKMNRVSLSVGVTTLLLASAIAPAFAVTGAGQSFTDVSASNPHYEAIMYLKSAGVIGGYPDGSFKPDQNISRVEALKLILVPQFKHWVTADGPIDAGASTPVSFSDTDKNSWYWTYIQKGYDDGLVQGYPDGTFKPASNVNKAENLKMLLTRYFADEPEILIPSSNNKGIYIMDNGDFNDVDQTAWYAKYFNAAAGLRVVDGKYLGEGNDSGPAVSIHPSAYITRGEFAEMVFRLMKKDDDGTDWYVPGYAASTVKMLDLSFALPTGWSVDKTESSSTSTGTVVTTDMKVPDPKYTVTIPVEIVKNPNYATMDDVQKGALLKTTDSGAKIYENECAPGIACYYVVYATRVCPPTNDSTPTCQAIVENIYDVSFGEPNSNEPAPANLDGPWFPSTTVTAADTLNFVATVK